MKAFGNADKNADCEDKSDEDFNTCCSGDYKAYTDEICNSLSEKYF